MGALEAFAIILSVVSLFISIVAFFASFKFYRDGVQLQQAANDALTEISEKTASIQTQVGGMFDKTLDAAIGKREILSGQFEELNEQLQKAKTKLIDESIGQIGAAGEQQRKRLASIVDDQIALIQEKVETTRESAEGMVHPESYSSLIESIRELLSRYPHGLELHEIYNTLRGSPIPLPPVDSFQHLLMNMDYAGKLVSSGSKYFAHNSRIPK